MNDQSHASDCYSPLLFDTPFEKSCANAREDSVDHTIDLTFEGTALPDTPINDYGHDGVIDISSSPGSDCRKQLDLEECVLQCEEDGSIEEEEQSLPSSPDLPVGLCDTEIQPSPAECQSIDNSLSIKHPEVINDDSMEVLDLEECVLQSKIIASPGPASPFLQPGNVHSKETDSENEEHFQDVLQADVEKCIVPSPSSTSRSALSVVEQEFQDHSDNNSVWDQFDDCGVLEFNMDSPCSKTDHLDNSSHINMVEHSTVSPLKRTNVHDISEDSCNESHHLSPVNIEVLEDSSTPRSVHGEMENNEQQEHFPNKLVSSVFHHESKVHDMSSSSNDDPEDDPNHANSPSEQDCVWDQFDDCGMMEDNDFVVDEHDLSGAVNLEIDPNTNGSSLDAVQDDLIKDEVEKLVQDEFDPPTDEETDISLVLKDANDSILWKSDNEPVLDFADNIPTCRPPTSTKVKKSRKKWVPPSPFTPMPKFKEMVTPAIKKACQKYGVRALPKKRMIALLEDIYKRTHKYETDSEYEGTPRPKVAKISFSDEEEEIQTNKIKTVNNGRKAKSLSKNKSAKLKSSIAKAKAKGTSAKVPSDDDLDSSSCSQDCSVSASQMPEESMMVPDEEKDNKLSKRDAAYKKEQIWNYIKENQTIYEQILHYETLDLYSFHQDLKAKGLNMGTNVVMDFLDEQNVQFTMKNQATSRTRRVKKKTKKEIGNSQKS